MCLGVDPFSYVTVAAACMAAYRHKFMSVDTIGYFSMARDRTRILAQEVRWLEFLNYSQFLSLKLPTLTIDSHPEVEHVRCSAIDDSRLYIYRDCLEYGCPKCFPTQASKRETHEDQMARLAKAGLLEVTVMWGCEWSRQCRTDPETKKFFLDFGELWHEPLRLRHAFYGGRTNAAQLYFHEDKESMEASYVDFTSLYPYINKYGRYPVGHPEIIQGDFTLAGIQNREYFGVVKCRIVPPRKLLHPVLPVRIRGKLMFPLCFTCAKDFLASCCHEDMARAFEGTWCTPEVYRAMDLGYKVIAVREVHHFPESSVGMFTAFVNTFLKVKQEASGFPQVCYDGDFLYVV